MRPHMNISTFAIITMIVMGIFMPKIASSQTARVLVPEGSFHSVLPEIPGEPIQGDSFYMDETAVTNEQFLEFLKERM